jgi:hypothetical protein
MKEKRKEGKKKYLKRYGPNASNIFAKLDLFSACNIFLSENGVAYKEIGS